MSNKANIKNLFLIASVSEMEAAKSNYRNDPVAIETLDSMIQECKDHNVDNYGETPL